jgi:D-xylose 1-dehydrogenase
MTQFARYPSLNGRTVLVTGGATGIGASLVEHFCAQGARVGFIDIAEEAGHALAARCAVSAATPPMFVAADLTDIDALRAAVDQVRQRLGPVTVLLNNAANDVRLGIESTTPQDWDAGVAVNLKHQFFAAQAVMSDMKHAGGGSIVNLGSISWMIKVGGVPVYSTCKAAVQGLSRSLAKDLGPYRIRVNALLPGAVLTEKQLRLWLDEAAVSDIQRAQCLKQPLMPEHVARMALFLAADDSAMCTGQDFIVDGGWA